MLKISMNIACNFLLNATDEPIGKFKLDTIPWLGDTIALPAAAKK